MKMKLMVLLLLCFMSIPLFAQDTQSLVVKTDGDVTLAQEKLIANAFTYINTVWADNGKSISRKATKKYFDTNTTLIINGRQVYTGYSQLESHFSQVGKNIHGKITFPLLEVMRADNKLIVHFNEDIYDNHGTYFPANVVAIFTLHEGRIQQWEEVVDSPYFCQAESAAAVYAK
jgi:hypothetical protein